MLRRAVYGPCRRLYSTAAAADSPQASVACTIPLSLCAAAGVTGAAIGCFVATALIHVHRAWKVDRELTQSSVLATKRLLDTIDSRVDLLHNRIDVAKDESAAIEKRVWFRSDDMENRLTERMDKPEAAVPAARP